MLDSNIVYKVTAAGVEEAIAKFKQLDATIQKMNFNANGTVTATGKATNALNAQSKAMDNVAGATQRASRAQGNYFLHIAKTTVQSALINKLFLEFVDISGQAIKQVDLMQNFPATMASMGESTKEATEAMDSLRTYIGQVGGNLGDATSLVTRFVGATGDVKAATAVFIGLNNALIAGDSSMEEQRQATIQFAQALERGRPDMREWRSLVQNMSFQMAQVATAMGYVNANALGEALTSGQESMAEFTTTLTELSTNMGPIAQQAMARMNGMQFAFNVLKNTMVQGLAEIINAIGRATIVSFFTYLTQVVKVLVSWVVTLINWLGALINFISRLFGGGNVFKKVEGDTAGVASNLATGAGAAKDLGDGLDGAGDSAKKLNKSLASFDKMNVLPDKESASGGGGSGKDAGGAGGAGFDPGQVGELGDIFGGLGKKIQEVSIWAKIFAGIIAALAGAWLFTKGVGAILAFSRALATAGGWAMSLARGLKFAGTLGAALGRGLFGLGSGGSGMFGKAAQIGAKIGLALRGGFLAVFSGIGTVLRVVLLNPLLNVLKLIWAPIAAVAGAIAAAFGIPFAAAVAIVVAIIAVIVGLIYLIWRNWETIWGWITTAFTASWNFIVNLWNTLYDIFAGPIKFIWQLISSIFILIVAIVATALELIFKLWVAGWKLIFTLLATVAGWIFDNVIMPVVNFFTWLWDTIVSLATAAWNWLFNNVLKPVATWIYNNVITPVVNFFKAGWDKITGFVSGFVDGVKRFMTPIVDWIRANIIDRIAGFFSGLWEGIKTGLSNAINALKNIFSGITEIFKTPINGIIDLINRVLQKLNQTVKVPDWVPGLGGKGTNFPMIPKLAKGGVVQEATLAMIGENGSEAVVPLENNTDWIDKLAEQIGSRGGSNQPMQITVQIGEEKIVTKMIDLINEKTQMSGRNTILV